jgi:hypothetical protein
MYTTRTVAPGFSFVMIVESELGDATVCPPTETIVSPGTI